MQDNRFLRKIQDTVDLSQGKGYYQRLINQHFTHYFSQRQLLSSVYNEKNLSTNYAIQLRARSLEIARLRLFLEEIQRDQFVGDARSEFLYKNFGAFLQIELPFFFPEESDEFYRTFIQALQAVVLKGSKKSAIEEGLRIFTQGLPFEVIEIYLNCRDRKDGLRRLSGFTIDPDQYTRIESLRSCDKSDTNIFLVKLDLDARPQGFNLGFVTQGIEFFLDIIKPAHTAYLLRWSLRDGFALKPDCVINYDLILGEKLAQSVSVSSEGVEIVEKQNNVLVLDNGDHVFVDNDTVIRDLSDADIFYSDLSVGDLVEYEASESPGRFKFTRPLQELPPEFSYTSVGYLRTPFANELDPALVSSNIFQMFVLKQLNENNKMEQVTRRAGICDIQKRKIYTWHYDDFRKCGSYRENYNLGENASNTYSSITNSIQLKNYPVTSGYSTGELATESQILLTINGNHVVPTGINPIIGQVLIDPSDYSPGDVIEVSYNWSENASLTLLENQEGNLLNKYSHPGDYVSTLNESDSTEPRKINWKLTSFALQASSLFNLSYSLAENTEDTYRHKLNDARVVRNYAEKACQVFNKTALLGLNTSGECLRYPTPPVQLRYSAESRLPDPWEIVEGSDLLNTLGEELNASNFLTNSVFRRLVFGSYDKRYAFSDIETSECGGEKTFYPFCEKLLSPRIGFSDEERFILPEVDYILLNDEGTLDNENSFWGVEYTGVIFRVSVKHQDEVDIFQDDDSLKVDFNNAFFDTYKNPPLNIVIENDAISDYIDGELQIPVLGFADGDKVLNDLGFELNEVGSSLNDQLPSVVGFEENERVVVIPPSRVFPGDGEDVVPPDLKSDPSDTNYVFYGKRTFDESVLWDIRNLIDDAYLFPSERYVLNQGPFALNDPNFILNAGDDYLVQTA